jgi:predicted GIY-YIG superfamily endonuclease
VCGLGKINPIFVPPLRINLRRCNMKIYVYGLYKEDFEYKSGKLDEGLFYIGVTKNIRTRYSSHKSKKSNPIKKSYIKKYGFQIKVLYEFNSYEDALERETFLIRWFGRIADGSGILANILIEQEDISKSNIGKKFSSEHRSRMSTSFLNRDEQYWDNQRDQRLSVPLEKIYDILKEWEDSFPIDKNICKKYNIKSNVFNWWIRKYRPDLRRLIEENRIKHISIMNSLGLTQSEYGPMIGVNYRTISSWKCKYIRDNMSIESKVSVKDLDYKKQKYEEWTKSGLSKREFCKVNCINYSSFKAWKSYYESY